MKANNNTPPAMSNMASTGIKGLDNILSGGMLRGRLYLVEGPPGAGKTTLSLQFLNEGARLGESTLYITLAESEVELRAVAASHGWTMDGIHIHEVIGDEKLLDSAEQYTVFHPTEIEMGNTIQNILSAVKEHEPARVVLDSLSELQLLAEHPLRYRRQVLALKQFFASRSCTTLFLDDRTASNGDLQVRSIAHAVLTLEQDSTDYGTDRRRARVVKYRGTAYRGGFHDYKIERGGISVFPRLVAAESRVLKKREQKPSGLSRLDLLLGGGLEEGTSTLISGPPGTGKSSLAAQFASAALKRGEQAALFLFEESANNLLNRTEALKMDLRRQIDGKKLLIQQIDPAELSPGEFAHQVCEAANNGARVVIIDSLNGYLNAMPDEKFLTTHLHELLAFLGQKGVVTILVGVQQGMLSGSMSSSLDASYLADNVIMLRYFESQGEVRQAISVFKKRGSLHERTIRRFSMSAAGIEVGDVLREFHGILTGVPTITAQDANHSGGKDRD